MKKLIVVIWFLVLFGNCNSQSGWHVQSIGSNSDLSTIQFIDSQTGWALSLRNIYKTTSGGINWFNSYYSVLYDLTGLYYFNNDTGIKCGYLYSHPAGPIGYIDMTVNGGLNWNNMATLPLGMPQKLYFYNKLLGWSIGCYRTTNGGYNWTSNGANGEYGLSDIRMINFYYGFCCGLMNIFKTTNSGDNWVVAYNNNNLFFKGIFFVDSLIGFSVGGIGPYPYNTGFIKKTTNGGSNWIDIFTYNQSLKNILFLDFNTGYTISQNKIFKTTNSGNNWVRQTCDTIYTFNNIFFSNSNTGWIACNGGILMHTTNGGNVLVKNISTSIPDKPSLFQNYPNPFNPSTNIRYQIKDTRFVTLKVYDILGKEVATLVNERFKPGEYEVQFPNEQMTNVQLPSEIYFYSLYSDGKLIDTKKMVLLK